MKIDKIKKLANGKYLLTMDNKEKIVTYEEVILNHNLLFSKEISDELLNELNIDNNYFDIYNRVIKYISIKMRSNFEIENYLDRLQVDETDKNKIINNLKQIGLINDLNYARAFIADKFNLTNMGPYKIKNELSKHNIDPDIIDAELNKYEDKFVYDKLNKLMVKRLKTMNNSKSVIKQKILTHFINLGYDKEMIISSFEQNIRLVKNYIERDYQIVYGKLSKKYTGKELEYKLIVKLYQKGYTQDEIASYLRSTDM